MSCMGLEFRVYVNLLQTAKPTNTSIKDQYALLHSMIEKCGAFRNEGFDVEEIKPKNHRYAQQCLRQ